MNIGVGVAREFEYWIFRREYSISVYRKHFFLFLFHFCNFIFSAQYEMFIRLIHLLLYASTQSIVLLKLNVKAKLFAFIHQNAKEIKVQKLQPSELLETRNKALVIKRPCS